MRRGKSLSTPPSGRCRRLMQEGGPNESRYKDSSSTNVNSLLGGQINGQRPVQLLVVRRKNYPRKRTNYQLANGMNMWKENGFVVGRTHNYIMLPRAVQSSVSISTFNAHRCGAEEESLRSRVRSSAGQIGGNQES